MKTMIMMFLLVLQNDAPPDVKEIKVHYRIPNYYDDCRFVRKDASTWYYNPAEIGDHTSYISVKNQSCVLTIPQEKNRKPTVLNFVLDEKMLFPANYVVKKKKLSSGVEYEFKEQDDSKRIDELGMGSFEVIWK